MRDMKDMGQQMGYRSLDSLCYCFILVPVFDRGRPPGRYGIYSLTPYEVDDDVDDDDVTCIYPQIPQHQYSNTLSVLNSIDWTAVSRTGGS